MNNDDILNIGDWIYEDIGYMKTVMVSLRKYTGLLTPCVVISASTSRIIIGSLSFSETNQVYSQKYLCQANFHNQTVD